MQQFAADITDNAAFQSGVTIPVRDVANYALPTLLELECHPGRGIWIKNCVPVLCVYKLKASVQL